jgi:hypothetical protein
MEDAEVAVIGMGSMMGTVREVVTSCAPRRQSGMIKLRLYRPFPTEEILKAIGKVPVLGVMGEGTASRTWRALSYEVKTALYDEKKATKTDYITGLAADTSPEMIRDVFEAHKIMEKGAVADDVSYIGVRVEMRHYTEGHGEEADALMCGARLCAGCDETIVARQVLKATRGPTIVTNATGCFEVSTTIFPIQLGTCRDPLRLRERRGCRERGRGDGDAGGRERGAHSLVSARRCDQLRRRRRHFTTSASSTLRRH